MKSQDVGLLLKLVSLRKQKMLPAKKTPEKAWPHDWQDWEDGHLEASYLQDGSLLNSEAIRDDYFASRYTARALEEETGISKSQVNLGLNRCYDVGLIKKDRGSNVPHVNVDALFAFIVHGLKYVFPAKPRELTRGIATGFASPVLDKKIMSAGEFVLVWPDAQGKTKGQAVEPLFKSATFAVRRDPEMYGLLALIDAIRLGRPREASLACEVLAEKLGLGNNE